jgi:hypothetical protein
MRFVFPVCLTLVLLVGCRSSESMNTDTSAAPPVLVLGLFEDDYGIQYTITPATWHQHPGTLYRVVRWHPEAQYLLAHNDAANPSDGGRWTRIDWMELPGMPSYTWGFCLSAYDAATLEEAEATAVADRDTPRTGCNGYPFSRMQREDPAE